jgi:hypothetical protein
MGSHKVRDCPRRRNLTRISWPGRTTVAVNVSKKLPGLHLQVGCYTGTFAVSDTTITDDIIMGAYSYMATYILAWIRVRNIHIKDPQRFAI